MLHQPKPRICRIAEPSIPAPTRSTPKWVCRSTPRLWSEITNHAGTLGRYRDDIWAFLTLYRRKKLPKEHFVFRLLFQYPAARAFCLAWHGCCFLWEEKIDIATELKQKRAALQAAQRPMSLRRDLTRALSGRKRPANMRESKRFHGSRVSMDKAELG